MSRQGAARAYIGSAPVVSRYSFCIVTEGRPGCWVYRETGYDKVRSSAAIRPSMRHYTTQEARDTVRRAETRRASAPVHAATPPGTGATWLGRGPRYGQARATTRRNASAACAQPGPWVCALCTRPSFDSGHCFESLFGHCS